MTIGLEAIDEPEPPKKKTPLIEEVTPSEGKKYEVQRPTKKMEKPGKKPGKIKGFFDRAKGGELYGDEGSTEGVVPDGAGDPLGYLPKGLRNKCKVVDTNKMSEAEKNETMQQYSDTGSVDVPDSRDEAANKKYWEEKRKNASKASGKQSSTGDDVGQKKADTKAGVKLPTDTAGMERLVKEGGFENMDFDSFMSAMDTHDIKPGQFAEEMRQLADVFVEGGAAQFDKDIMDLAEKAAEDMANCSMEDKYGHLKKGNKQSAAAKFGEAMFGAAGGSFQAGSKDGSKDGPSKANKKAEQQKADPSIWDFEEVEEVPPATEAPPKGAAVPKHSTKVLKGDDIDEDKLEVTVHLPLLATIADVDLEIENRTLSLEVEGVYTLTLPLEHYVDEDAVRARFDKSARNLVVAVPINY